jgi:hypothetical protein
MVGYNKTLISRWTQIYQKARFIVKQAQSNDNISAYTHDLMQRILAKEIHHVRALADTGTLIPKGSSGYKLFPTPRQAARIDHFCEYLYKLLQNPMSPYDSSTRYSLISRHFKMISPMMLLLMWTINLILWLQDTNLVGGSTTYNDNKTGYLSIKEYSTYRYYVSTCIIMCQHTIDQYQSKRT